jgi:hypothetical protein
VPELISLSPKANLELALSFMSAHTADSVETQIDGAPRYGHFNVSVQKLFGGNNPSVILPNAVSAMPTK